MAAAGSHISALPADIDAAAAAAGAIKGGKQKIAYTLEGFPTPDGQVAALIAKPDNDGVWGDSFAHTYVRAEVFFFKASAHQVWDEDSATKAECSCGGGFPLSTLVERGLVKDMIGVTNKEEPGWVCQGSCYDCGGTYCHCSPEMVKEMLKIAAGPYPVINGGSK